MSSNSIEDRLDADYAKAWQPVPGGKIVGETVAISERVGGYGRYPIVTLRQEDGEERAIHAFHEVLQNELARIAPKIGDTIGIKYGGKDAEKGYHRYRVVREGDDGEGAFDWNPYGDDGDDSDDDSSESHVPADTSDFEDEPAEGSSAAERAAARKPSRPLDEHDERPAFSDDDDVAFE